MIRIRDHKDGFEVERRWGRSEKQSVVFTSYAAAKKFASREGRRLEEVVIDEVSVTSLGGLPRWVLP